MNDAPSKPTSIKLKVLQFLATAIVCLTILGVSVATIVVINQTEPKAQQIEATRKSAAIVETVTVEKGTYAPTLVVLGTVQAAQEITLSPRVNGQVVSMSPKFVPGGMVKTGDFLLQIDPADFENTISMRESELQQAVALLDIERGRQSLAKKELALLEGTIDEANRALVLREPQYESIQAEVNAAKAAIERARLDLKRTSIAAPFDAQILERSVNVGSQVSPSEDLARLVGVDEYWIMASVPVRSLKWIQFPEHDGRSSLVTLRDPDTWPSGVERYASVARMIGSLDQQTRLARVLIVVADPLAMKSDVPPLILDTLIETHIEGRPIENVVRLKREFVHNRDTVWVMKDDKLEIRETSVVFRDAKYAYIDEGLESGDEVVTTTLATVATGIGLKKMDASPEPQSEESQE
ncbi:efflux RND transporter periplasmic adaptor subunit [Bremerella alba]|uniref:Multidrug resistance protein MdtA n=1 Tax=Bremerella alba TaxID=980252 RepID=A0A7V9A7I1_9BACT|nr:efflux RND transporter periplasmic adaptor subunit [Bremerella alba]MBA2115402.1 Multidrug resistance protein MdtA [Bremerella alba]